VGAQRDQPESPRPDLLQWAPNLPGRPAPGKIMRRILRKIAADEHTQLGDVSTLADRPSSTISSTTG